MSPLERGLRTGNANFPEDLDKPVLILTVGLPRSGKSTWARQQDVPIVNPDAVRLAFHGKPFLSDAEPWIWVTVRTMIKALFHAGHFVVILDACHATDKRRDGWQDPQRRLAFKEFTTTSFKPAPAHIQECIQRARASARNDLVPIIERMSLQWEALTMETRLHHLLPSNEDDAVCGS